MCPTACILRHQVGPKRQKQVPASGSGGPQGAHGTSASMEDTGAARQLAWRGSGSTVWVLGTGGVHTCTHGDALGELGGTQGVDTEGHGPLRDSAPDRPGATLSSVRSGEGPQERDIILPYPDRIPSGNTRAIRCWAQVSISFSVCGPSWPQTGLDKPGSQVVQAVLGWGTPQRYTEDLGTIPFLTPSEKHQRRVRQDKHPTKHRGGGGPMVPDSIPLPPSPCSRVTEGDRGWPCTALPRLKGEQEGAPGPSRHSSSFCRCHNCHRGPSHPAPRPPQQLRCLLCSALATGLKPQKGARAVLGPAWLCPHPATYLQPASSPRPLGSPSAAS